MRFRVKHITHYKYAQRVTRCYNLANVIPRTTNRQQHLKNHISISPLPVTAHQHVDYFGNNAYHFEIQKPHKELIITADSDIEVSERNIELDLSSSYGNALEYLRTTINKETIEAREFLLDFAA